jgi:hypothetical protein
VNLQKIADALGASLGADSVHLTFETTYFSSPDLVRAGRTRLMLSVFKGHHHFMETVTAPGDAADMTIDHILEAVTVLHHRATKYLDHKHCPTCGLTKDWASLDSVISVVVEAAA